MKIKIVSIYSLIHFIVDLSCAILVTNLVKEQINNTLTLFIAVFLYNFFAFAVQFPIGIIADKVNKNALFSAIGCILVAIGYGLSSFGVIACIVAGIGNAMFHVGGGIDVLNISEKKASLSGVFVSTGAMGIFLGSKSLEWNFNKFYIIVLILIFSAILLFWLYNQIKDKVKNEEIIIPNLNKNEHIAILCFIVTVCIRGYVGLILSFDWKSNFILAFVAILAVVFGKMLGGVIGDKIGFKKISVISLAIASIGFIFAFNNSIIGIIAILCFNMTMPITLTALSNILNKNKGLAFGLLTFALFIGYVPVAFGYTTEIFTPVGLFVITIVSLIILFIGIKKYEAAIENK